ncbi:hypothetical protein C0Q70_14207 [Pomacea canaliculata]|uniref:Uncharacterized protein n=1 Tax=Pomacea canaliculata TaxID=400727 RepID=A0A2T7NZE2_POMCA|nr:hypothetical protein C0Q70_14207 [Pomacea canaliculata]
MKVPRPPVTQRRLLNVRSLPFTDGATFPRHRPLLSSGKYYTTHGRLREPDPSRAFHAEGNHANEPTHLHDDTRNAVSKHASKLGKMNQGGQFFASGHPSGSWQGSKNDLTHDNMQTSGDENSQYGPAQQETGEQTGPSSHLQPSSDQSDYQSHKDHEYIDGQPKLSAQNRDRADPSSQATEDNSEDTPDEGAEAFAEENTGMAGKNAEATDTKIETAVKSSRNTLTGQGQENSLDGQPKLSAQNRDRADASSQATEDNSEDTPDEVAEAFAEENTAIDDTNAEDTGDKMKSTRSKSTGQETYVRSSENGMKESRALDSAQTDDGTDREGLMKIIGMLIKSEEAMKSLSNMLSSKQENLDCSTTAEECVDNDQPSEDLAASSVPEDSPGDRQQNLRIQEEKVPDTARSSVEDASNPVSPTVSDELDVIGIDPVSQDANKEKFDSPSMPTTSVVEVDEEHLQKDSTAFGQQDSATHVDDEENLLSFRFFRDTPDKKCPQKSFLCVC